MDQLRVVLVFSALFVGAFSADLCVQHNSGIEPDTFHRCTHGCCYKYIYPCCDKPYSSTNPSLYVTITSAVVVPFVLTIALCLIIRKRRQLQLSRLRTPPPVQFHLQQQVFHTPGTNLAALPSAPSQPFPPVVLPSYSEAIGVNVPPPPDYKPYAGKPVDQHNMPSL